MAKTADVFIFLLNFLVVVMEISDNVIFKFTNLPYVRVLGDGKLSVSSHGTKEAYCTP